MSTRSLTRRTAECMGEAGERSRSRPEQATPTTHRARATTTLERLRNHFDPLARADRDRRVRRAQPVTLSPRRRDGQRSRESNQTRSPEMKTSNDGAAHTRLRPMPARGVSAAHSRPLVLTIRQKIRPRHSFRHSTVLHSQRVIPTTAVCKRRGGLFHSKQDRRPWPVAQCPFECPSLNGSGMGPV